jgi:hypothetical protein
MAMDHNSRSVPEAQRGRASAASRELLVQTHEQAIRRTDVPHADVRAFPDTMARINMKAKLAVRGRSSSVLLKLACR